MNSGWTRTEWIGLAGVISSVVAAIGGAVVGVLLSRDPDVEQRKRALELAEHKTMLAEKERDKLRGEADLALVAKAEGENKLKEVEGERDRATQEVEGLKRTQTQLETEIATLADSKKKLVQELDEHKQELTRYEQELQKASRDYEHKQNQIKEASITLEAQKEEFDKQLRLAVCVKQHLEAPTASCGDALASIKALEQSILLVRDTNKSTVIQLSKGYGYAPRSVQQ